MTLRVHRSLTGKSEQGREEGREIEREEREREREEERQRKGKLDSTQLSWMGQSELNKQAGSNWDLGDE